jgi:tetratricopeptide (TPR) repeat protein
LLALLSKTVTAVLPAIILVIFWWRRGRLEWKRDALPLVPWLAMGMTAGLFTAWVERTYIGARGADFLLTPIQRVLIAGRAIFFYAHKLVWPANLAFFYPHWDIDATVWWQWLFPVGVVGLTIGLGFAARRTRGPLAGLLVFSGALFPVLGFLNVYPFRYSYVADHFQYLASLGIIVPGIAWSTSTVRQTSLGKSATVVFSVLLIGVLGVLTWRQSGMYRDIETLYRESLEHNPHSGIAHRNLGVLLAERPDELVEAINEYQAALKIDPNDSEALYNLGIAYARTPDRLQDAIAAYQAALRTKPDYAEAHNNLGTALARIPGREKDAIAEYQAALKIYPDFADAHYNFGNMLSRLPGRQKEAIAEYEAAVKIDPDCAGCHYNLGNVLLRIPARLADATREYRAALKIKPDFAEAHNNLGMVLAQIPGHLPDAIQEYETAIKIKPNLADAHFNMGNALAQLPGRSQDAIVEYKTAAEIVPSYASFVSERIRQIDSGGPRPGESIESRK